MQDIAEYEYPEITKKALDILEKFFHGKVRLLKAASQAQVYSRKDYIKCLIYNIQIILIFNTKNVVHCSPITDNYD